MDKKTAEQALKSIPKLSITKKLYELKEKGDIPYASVNIKGGKITCVVVNIMGVDYYFHKTSRNKKDINIIEKEWVNHEKKIIKNYKVPFDGWSFGGDGINPFEDNK